MVFDTRGGRTLSLGDLIAALRPGDDCPWCGARLQGGASLKQVDVTSARGEDRQGVCDSQEALLVCSECGFQVCPAGQVTRPHGRRALGAAA
jgi:hypothetical protein